MQIGTCVTSVKLIDILDLLERALFPPPIHKKKGIIFY